MKTELHPDQLLEERLRATCRAVVPHLGEEWSVAATTRVPDRAPTTMRPWGVRIAMVGLLATVGIVIAVKGGSSNDPLSPAGATPAASALDCGPGADQICVDRLDVAPGANDYFTGPASLGAPIVHPDLFDQVGLIRCTALDADGRECQHIEGLAVVALVTYATDVPSDSVPAARTNGQGSAATMWQEIEVGTTYAPVTPREYADEWGWMGTINEGVAVRGHAAVRFEYAERTYTVWQEDTGLLVWVGVPTAKADELQSIAEGVQRVSGPRAMPYVVAVPALGTPWDVNSNNGDALVFWRQDGVLYAGPGYADASGAAAPVGVPFVVVGSQSGPDRVKIGGAGPVGATQVQLTIGDLAATTIDLTQVVGVSDARFFYLTMENWNGGSVTFSWLDANGSVLESGTTDVNMTSGTTETTVMTSSTPPLAP